MSKDVKAPKNAKESVDEDKFGGYKVCVEAEFGTGYYKKVEDGGFGFAAADLTEDGGDGTITAAIRAKKLKVRRE